MRPAAAGDDSALLLSDFDIYTQLPRGRKERVRMGVGYDFDSLSQADMAPLCNRQHTPSAPSPPCSLMLLYAAEQSVEGSALSAETESFSWASKLTQLLAEEALMLSSCSDERRATIIEMLPATCNLQPATDASAIVVQRA